MYKVILFDLDGTLTESGEGITKSVQYALERIGKPEPDLEKLKVFIGPPLMEMFMQYAQIDEATAKQAVEIYREDVLKRLNMDKHRDQVIMVGDKEHDVYGARKAGLECIAVSFGYGTEEELKQAEPLKIVDSAEGIVDFFA